MCPNVSKYNSAVVKSVIISCYFQNMVFAYTCWWNLTKVLVPLLVPACGDSSRQYILSFSLSPHPWIKWPPFRRRHIQAHFLESLQWRHDGRDNVSNHQPHDCLLNRLFGRRSKKTSKLRVTGLYAGNSPVTGEFPVQRASNAENVSIWWRHHVKMLKFRLKFHYIREQDIYIWKLITAQYQYYRT